MKRKILSYLILFISLNAIGKPTVTISGTILNFTGDTVNMYVSTNFISKTSAQVSKVDKNGNFKFELDIKGSKSAFFNTGKYNIGLFITEGDSIVCTYDFNKIIESIQFSGNRASHYNYFISYYRKFGLPHAMFTRPDFSDIFNMSPEEFKSYRESKVVSDLDFLKKYCTTHDVTNEFKKYCEIEINYSYYYALASYESLRKYFKKITDTLPDGFYNELSSELFNKDDYLISENYCDAMLTYVEKLKSGVYKDPVSFYNKALNFSDKEFNNKSLDFCKAKLISGLLISGAPDYFKDSIVTGYINKSKYPDYIASITSIYTKSLSSQTKKIPAEALRSEIATIDGQSLTFGKILKRYENKVIYLDIWASFCGPCKVEMPYSAKLRQNLSDKDVVFIYLSVDENISNWEKGIETFGISGEKNYLLKMGLDSAFAKHFNINAIPHYILIDKQGNVVFPTAAQPSSESIEQSILTLSEQ